MESLPNIQLRFPDRVFSGMIELHSSNRYVELIEGGHDHTAGDLYLRIPAESIAFIGDIGFFNEQPYMADSNPEGRKSMLNELIHSEYKTFIPGHGPAGSENDIALIEEYINLLEALVSNAIEQGASVDDVIEQELPEPFRTWSIGSPRFEINCRFMIDHILMSK